MDDLDAIAREVAPHADQAHAATVSFARLLAAYWATLCANGVDAEAATYLTQDYQRLCILRGGGRGEG